MPPTSRRTAVALGAVALTVCSLAVAGPADAAVALPADLEPGEHELVLTGTTTGTSVVVPLTVAASGPDSTTTTASAAPTQVETHKGRTTLTVSVASSGDTAPTGTVTVLDGDEVVGTGELDAEGGASIVAEPLEGVRTHTLTVRYEGDDTHATSETTVDVEVVKQTPTLTINAPATIRKGTAPSVTVRVRATGLTPTGLVVLGFRGQQYKWTLRDGAVTVKLPVQRTTGTFTLQVRYDGNQFLTSKYGSTQIRVTN